MKDFRTIIAGIMVGIANIIPGVSGGTVLVLLGIYDTTINSAQDLLDKRKRATAIFFLAKLLIGVAIGLVGAAIIITKLLEINTPLTLTYFGGLIIFSTPRFIKENFDKNTSFKIVPFLIGLAGLLTLIILSLSVVKPDKITEIPALDIKLLSFLAISGVIAGFAMIFPGISGSMIQLLIGSYVYFSTFISKVLDFNIDLYIYLGAMGTGIFIGIILSVVVSKYLLSNYRSSTLSFILALIVASTIGLYITVFIDFELSFINFLYFGLTIIGAYFTYFTIEEIAKKI